VANRDRQGRPARRVTRDPRVLMVTLAPRAQTERPARKVHPVTTASTAHLVPPGPTPRCRDRRDLKATPDRKGRQVQTRPCRDPPERTARPDRRDPKATSVPPALTGRSVRQALKAIPALRVPPERTALMALTVPPDLKVIPDLRQVGRHSG